METTYISGLFSLQTKTKSLINEGVVDGLTFLNGMIRPLTNITFDIKRIELKYEKLSI